MEILSGRILIRPTDPARTTTFYREVLGLAIAREFPGGTVFFAGQTMIEVSSRVDAQPTEATQLWLQVRDLAAARSELAAREASILREPELEPWGLREMWLTDPDGLRIVLVEVPPDHPMRRDTRS